MEQLYEKPTPDHFGSEPSACRLTQSRIIFCAFQGIGGAGIYSMVMAVMAEVTPVESIGPVTGLMSTIFALSSILGPVLGSAITTNASWRWVFYLK